MDESKNINTDESTVSNKAELSDASQRAPEPSSGSEFLSKMSKDIVYIGVDDHAIDLFEGQYDVRKNGMSYNSYVIIDKQIAVTDTVDAHFGDEWLAKLKAVLHGREPDYLIVHHMEPDHSANIARFIQNYPQARIVASAAAFNMMKAYFGTDFSEQRIIAKEGFELELGVHKLRFIAAPMVHWPEVLFSYETHDRVLFSADAFGKFGALDTREEWACEARRYYFGIVGKFGVNVQAVLNKLSGVKLRAIYPLHGPMLTQNLDYYLGLYKTWSRYEVESEGIALAYTSVYGHTKKAVEELCQLLTEKGCPALAVNDLARDDLAEAVEDAFRYGTLVLATTTYCGGIFPFMHTFLEALNERRYQKRRVALIENCSWAPAAAKLMKAKLENMSDIEILEPVVSLKGALSQTNRTQLDALADVLLEQ